MNREKIDCYPWATPTEEQKLMFDRLSYEEQLEMLRSEITKGLESGVCDRSLSEILSNVKARDLDKKFDQSEKDVLDSFDLKKSTRPNRKS